MQHVKGDVSFNKGSLKIFHQNVQSLRNKKVNLKILLHKNLSTIDVLGFTEHWLFEDETSCYNFPNLSLVSKHRRKGIKYGGSGILCTVQYIS
jgi:hypothetical protein